MRTGKPEATSTFRRSIGLALCFFFATIAGGQQFDEYTLAAALRSQKVQQFGTVEGTEANVVGESVFSDLTRALSISYGAKPYELRILADPSPNASSVGAGKVFVNLGLVPLLGASRGLWAAVLGHELAHDLLHHAYRNYVLLLSIQQTQAALQQAQSQSRSTTQAIVLALAETGNQLLGLKVLRDEENQADRAGMFIMARAGYHPDFALDLNRILTQEMGDIGKFRAFFETHPRMETRALRQLKEYDQAEAEFARFWQDASQSPGGVPPPIAIITSVGSSQDKPNKALYITAEFEAHNVDPSALLIFSGFRDHGRPVPTASKQNSIRGWVAGFGTVERTGPKLFGWKASVPTSALSTGHRKFKASVVIAFDNDGRSQTKILDYSSPIQVEFPK